MVAQGHSCDSDSRDGEPLDRYVFDQEAPGGYHALVRKDTAARVRTAGYTVREVG